MNRWIARWVFLLLLLPFAAPLSATGLLDVVVQGNELRAGVALPGNIGADFTISFEQVEGLSAESLGLSVDLVSLLDPQLLSRLGNLSIPNTFPLLLRIQPPAQGGLSFNGVVTIGIHTHNLLYLPNTPLRLFAASEGGPFEDITTEMGMGSYRARGRKGHFSEFLILVDVRPVNRVIARKLDRLDQLLVDHQAQIPASVLAELSNLAAEIRSRHSAGQKQAAIDKTQEFLAVVQQHSGGAEIPNVWRSTRDVTNVAGLLRAAGETLRFSLILKKNQGFLGIL